MQVALIFLPTILLAVSVSAAPTNDYAPSSEGRLHIICVADNSLEAIFYNADAGIRIIANSLSLSLYSMDGEELLLSGDKPHGSSLFATIMGHSFLHYNTTLEDGTSKILHYIVPDPLAEEAKEALKSAKEERMLSQLSDEGTEQASQSAYQELLQRPEIMLLESAAVALGQAGVMGYENQGALNFYAAARALIKLRGREEEGEEEQNEENRQEDEVIENRQKRIVSNIISCFFGERFCWNNLHCCDRCPVGWRCKGMCGPLCLSCWWWFCGTCCYHQGCWDHDNCCERDGRLSYACTTHALNNFRCSGYSC